VKQIVGLDPSPKLLDMARAAARRTSIPLELLEGTAEAIPIEDRSMDTVVTTWSLCSIPLAQRALEDMRRVLKPADASFSLNTDARRNLACSGGRTNSPRHGNTFQAGVTSIGNQRVDPEGRFSYRAP